MMSPATWHRVKALYAAAAELAEAEREAFVEQQRNRDPRVVIETLRLLRADRLPPPQRVEPLRISPMLLNTRADQRLEPGQLLANRYLVRRFVASGGVGEVYEAEDRERAERVALKIFRAEFASSDHIPWLRREVELARRVRHPNVCRVYDLVVDGGLVFLTMEFLDGETLAAYLRREGSFTERRVLPLLRQMIAGLAAAHEQGVVHRDFKPGNVMIVPRLDGPPRAVITDFGLARTSSEQRRATVTVPTTQAFGTPAYMAPEQVSGEPAARPADIYALGVVLYEMLTGELPFADESALAMAVRKTRERPESPRRYAPALRANWERVILRCLDPKPGRRFSDVRYVLQQLESRTGTRSRWSLQLRAIREAVRPRVGLLLAVAAVAVLTLTWQLWPRAVSAETSKAWEAGVFALQAGEPLVAVRRWEQIAARPLPARAPLDLALAWHALGFPSRAQAELARANRAEAEYASAVAEWIKGDGTQARQRLLRRSQANPHDAVALADAAAFGHSELWRRVVEMRPGHGGAHLRLAEAAAQAGSWTEAERHFLLASTHFHAAGLPAMVAAVSARRGLQRLSSGDAAAARVDLQPGLVSLAGVGAGACERVVVVMSGEADEFRAPMDPITYLSSRFAQAPRPAASRLFDNDRTDGALQVSLPLPPYRFCSAQLSFRMRRNVKVGGSINDTLTMGVAPFDSLVLAPQVLQLWATYDGADVADLSIELKADFLAGVQRVYAGLPVASLDVMAADDTDFDYLKLTLVY